MNRSGRAARHEHEGIRPGRAIMARNNGRPETTGMATVDVTRHNKATDPDTAEHGDALFENRPSVLPGRDTESGSDRHPRRIFRTPDAA